MQSAWRVGKILGIPLLVDTSWFFILALFTYFNASDWQQGYPEWGVALAWLTGLGMSLSLFASVLLHELGHSLVAKSQGIQVNSITLFLFGGIAAIDQESKTPGQAFQVAIAGPVVSLIIFGLAAVAAELLPVHSPIAILTTNLSQMNLVLALFNLLPGLPLDGGQVLKAAVWKITGNRFQGVHWAARVGQALGWTAIILGVAALLLLGTGSGLWIALMGWFAVRNATNYNRAANLQEAVAALTASDAMSPDFRVVEATLSLREFAERYLISEIGDHRQTPISAVSYFAAADGRYRGLVRPNDLSVIERSLWDSQTVQQLVTPLSEIPTVVEKTSLPQVIALLEDQKLGRVTVLSPAGAVAGIIDRGDVVKALAKKMGWPLSEADIRRIKEEGNYPPGLALGALAQMILRDQEPVPAPVPVTPSISQQ
jgi:Zn-dependent protease